MTIELIPLAILLIAFFIYGIIIWAVDINRAEAKDFHLDGDSLDQGIVVGFSIAIFFSYVPMAIWFRIFQIYEYNVTCKLLISAILAFVTIIGIFVIYGAIIFQDVKSKDSITIIV